jgi:hypothetical protein
MMSFASLLPALPSLCEHDEFRFPASGFAGWRLRSTALMSSLCEHDEFRFPASGFAGWRLHGLE